MRGLVHSERANYYGIADRDEAEDYLMNFTSHPDFSVAHPPLTAIATHRIVFYGYLMEEFGDDALHKEGINLEIPDIVIEEENEWIMNRKKMTVSIRPSTGSTTHIL